MGILTPMITTAIASAVIVAVFILFWKIWFRRNPDRKIPPGKNIISPADGKINRIIEFDSGKADKIEIEKGLLGKISVLTGDVAQKCTVVSIVMTPLDVHYQRAPIEGTVEKVYYKKGRFKNAVSKDIAIDNERNEILINKEGMKIKVIQIAGALARRIRCFVEQGQKVSKGELLGLINLGSQVSLIIPAKIEVLVSEGQKVKAGETVIAKIK